MQSHYPQNMDTSMPRLRQVHNQYWYYKDDFSHARHYGFLKTRSSARSRGEDWQLTIEEYFALWEDEDVWNQRGKSTDSYVLTRRDRDRPWTLENSEVIRRRTLLSRTRHGKFAHVGHI